MKKYLLILTICLVCFSCKKRIEESVALPSEIIKIGVKSGNAGTDMDVFEIGDNIGIYTIAKDDEQSFQNFIYANYGYTYDVPYWSPVTNTKVLNWSDDDPSIYIYAYHPYTEADGSARSVENTTNDLILNYELPLDQSNIEGNLKKYDFMRSVNKGVNDEGLHKLTMNGNPVHLKFYHKLCKLEFNIKVVKPEGVEVLEDKAYLTNITIEGQQIASQLKMSLKDGSTVSSGFNSEVQWNGNVEIPVATDFNSATSVFVTNMLVIPFVQVNEANVMKFTIKFKDGQHDVIHILTAKIKEPVNYGDLSFNENQYNKMTVQAKLSGIDEIKITTTIADWDKSEHEIAPQ